MNTPLTVTIVLLLLISAPAGAQSVSDSGLETANYKSITAWMVLIVMLKSCSKSR